MPMSVYILGFLFAAESDFADDLIFDTLMQGSNEYVGRKEERSG